MTRHVFFFPQYSFQLIFHHWKCCRTFFLLEMSAQMKCMAACFLFYRIFFSISVLFVYALLILIWHLKPAGFWKLADSDWVCLMGVKAQIKKDWMCIHWYEMWNKTTTIHPHCQLMVKSCIVLLPLYTVHLSKISLRTQTEALHGKGKASSTIDVLDKLVLLSSMHCCLNIFVL